jgi:Tfp pilus assembly protein PilV
VTHERPPRPRARLAAEDGFGLIEVVISAVILLSVTLGTLSLLDTSAHSTVQSRARTVAADLAEQDQEQLRGMRVTDLSNFSRTRSVTVGGVAYKVDSATTWFSDATGGDVSCTSGSGQADYMRITSTVTDAKGSGDIAPVKVVSLLAPPVGSLGSSTGTLAVPLAQADGSPLTGIPVSISGPVNASLPTNAAGCAVFNYFPVGSYTVALNQAGYVNQLGVQNVTYSGTINPGSVNVTTNQAYDKAVSIPVSFQTQATSGGPKVPAAIAALSAANSGIGNATGSLVFGSTSTPVSPATTSQTATSLFPFTDGYTIYAGSCAANAPGRYTSTGGTATSVPVTPGLAAPAQTLFVPSVTVSSSTTMANVKLIPTDAGCTQAYWFRGVNTRTLTVPVPWGKYKVCADTGSRYSTIQPAVDNTRGPGPNAVSVSISSTFGTC